MLLLIPHSIQFEWNMTPNIAIQCNIEENAYNRTKPKTYFSYSNISSQDVYSSWPTSISSLPVEPRAASESSTLSQTLNSTLLSSTAARLSPRRSDQFAKRIKKHRSPHLREDYAASWRCDRLIFAWLRLTRHMCSLMKANVFGGGGIGRCTRAVRFH